MDQTQRILNEMLLPFEKEVEQHPLALPDDVTDEIKEFAKHSFADGAQQCIKMLLLIMAKNHTHPPKAVIDDIVSLNDQIWTWMEANKPPGE